jgi:hypothetical protein
LLLFGWFIWNVWWCMDLQKKKVNNLWCFKIWHSAAWKTGTNVPEKCASSILRFRQSSTLKEEVECSFETLVPIYTSTWHHITDIQSETLITPYMLLLLLILCHLIYQCCSSCKLKQWSTRWNEKHQWIDMDFRDHRKSAWTSSIYLDSLRKIINKNGKILSKPCQKDLYYTKFKLYKNNFTYRKTKQFQHTKWMEYKGLQHNNELWRNK